VQAVLFAITIVMLMQESTKVVLYSLSAYLKDGTNIRRSAACIMYIGGVLLALYRESGVVRAISAENPIPLLVSISDSRVSGLYAEVRCSPLTNVCSESLLNICTLRPWLHCSCGLKCVPFT
jgi:hypothetical protein